MVKSEGLLSLLADEIINKKGLKVGGDEWHLLKPQGIEIVIKRRYL